MGTTSIRGEESKYVTFDVIPNEKAPEFFH